MSGSQNISNDIYREGTSNQTKVILSNEELDPKCSLFYTAFRWMFYLQYGFTLDQQKDDDYVI